MSTTFASVACNRSALWVGPWAWVLAVAAVSAVSAVAGAQAPLTNNDYAIEAVDLPILGAPRAVGLGGAYASAGEGIAAVPWNPAAAATRARWERSWFAWEVSLGALFPSRADSNRIFGRTADGGVLTDSFRFFDLGLRLQFGPAAFGVIVRPRTFTVTQSGGELVTTTSQTGHVDVASQFLHGDLVVGVGLRAVNLSVSSSTGGSFAIQGLNAEVGATYRPHRLPFRTSLVVRLPIRGIRGASGPGGPVSVPRSVNLPWELSVSGAFGFGARPFNAATPTVSRGRVRRRLEREATARRETCIEEAWQLAGQTPDSPPQTLAPGAQAAPPPREIPPLPAHCFEFVRRSEPTSPPLRPRYGFVTAELVFAGQTPNGIGLDGYITQTRRTWGSHVTVSPRLGVEGEPWRNRMKLRGGIYREPDRSSLASPRTHFTSGFDLRLFDWDVFGLFSEAKSFQITATSDVSVGYLSFGIGVGFWH